jgi:hypothetical protein
MKRAGVLVLVGLALLSGARPVSACDCVRLKPLSASVRTEAPFIFEGQVVEIVERSLHITRTTPSDSNGETRPLGREVVFRVTRAWAGAPGRRISVFLEDGDCTFPFQAGHQYVVFARRGVKGRPTTGICMRTAEVDRAQAVLKALGPPRPVRRQRG